MDKPNPAKANEESMFANVNEDDDDTQGHALFANVNEDDDTPGNALWANVNEDLD